MKSIGIATAILAATIALAGCKNRKEEPIPGPKAALPAAGSMTVRPPSATPPSDPSSEAAGHPSGARRHGSSGISWFQGAVDEAFSTTCGKCTAMFWQEALDSAFDR
jgi:hypothetical protein